MANNNRARQRAVRAEMASSGENYSRAARSVPRRPSRRLRAVCFTCRNDIPDGGGVIHILHREVSDVMQAQAMLRDQRAAKAEAEGRSGDFEFLSVEELLADPEEAQWKVHCDACNPQQQKGCEGCYWFGVERCRTWAQLVDWTAHFFEKGWVATATNWTEFIRGAARGTGSIGLICDPADRYSNT